MSLPPACSAAPGAPGASAPQKVSPVMFLLLALAVGVFTLGVLSHLAVPARLVLQSDPAGASVFLNGRLCGATPLSTTALPPGRYSLRLEKAGYAPVTRALELPREGLTLRESLPRRGTGALEVGIKPANAEVLLDGEFLGHTPLLRTDIPAGPHLLIVRKTNFKTYQQEVEIKTGETASFKNFALEDTILAMLQRSIETEKWRVAHYMDLGHYLFINDELEKSAEMYAMALEISGSPLTLPDGMDPAEVALQAQLRAEDINRLSLEIKAKYGWKNKDVTRFRQRLEAKKETLVTTSVTEWTWVRDQVDSYNNEGKPDKAEALLLRHLAIVKQGPALGQAHIALLQVREKLHALGRLREELNNFNELFGNDGTLLRQAGDELYRNLGTYKGEERQEILAMAESLFRNGVKRSRGNVELAALCKFELANVLASAGRGDEAEKLYDESVAETQYTETRKSRLERKQAGLREAAQVKAEPRKTPPPDRPSPAPLPKK